MLDHIGFAISDIERSRAFYEAALAAARASPRSCRIWPGARPTAAAPRIGFGKDGMPFFWIGDNERVGEGTHVAFTAPDRATVDAFYEAAIAAGGKDNGAPGLRPQYHPNYYGAFVLDPDGINIEAVCHRPEWHAHLHHRL